MFGNDLDLSALDEANTLLGKPRELYKRIENRDRALNLLVRSLQGLELMIQTYIKQFPEHSERELTL